MTLAFATFDTAVGPCAVAWGERGIVGVSLAEGTSARARDRIARRFPEAVEAEPTEAVQHAMDRMAGLMEGARDDLADIALDWSGVAGFDRAVLDICRAIPPGQTLTYGEIARRLGDLNLARGVGQALGRNPFPVIVPCQLVQRPDGQLRVPAEVLLEPSPWPSSNPDGAQPGGATGNDVVVHAVADVRH